MFKTLKKLLVQLTLKHHETLLLNAPYDQPRAGVFSAAAGGHVRVSQCIVKRPGDEPGSERC